MIGSSCSCSSSSPTDKPEEDSSVSTVFVEPIEAEDGTDVGQMAAQSGVLADPACNGSWVEVPTGSGVSNFDWSSSAPELPPHRSELSVTLPHDGTYYVWLRIAALSSDNDAMYAGFDADDMRRVFPPDDYPLDLSWIWVSQADGDPQRLVFENLSAGKHTLIIGHGEAGIRIDKVVIADRSDAQFDRSCPGPQGDTCGDGEITGSEVCDTQGPNLGGATCESEGYAGGGELGCAANCSEFIYTNCDDTAVDCHGIREYDWTDLPDGTITSSYFCDHHWGLNYHYDPDSISVTSATNRLREPGTKSLRFYINPTTPEPPEDGDDGNLRAEIYEAYLFSTGETVSWGPRKPLKSEEWIGWSYYFPSDFIAGDTSSTKFLQCHVGSGAAPIDLRTWNPTEYPNTGGRCPGDTCDEFVLTRLWPDDSSESESLITDFKPMAGQWVDFVLHVVWDTEEGGDGITEFWVNGVKYEGTPGATTFDSPYGDDPYGAMVKLGMYHGSWRYQSSIDASLAEGVEDLEIFMGPVRILSRLQGDHIGADGYGCVAPKGPRP